MPDSLLTATSAAAGGGVMGTVLTALYNKWRHDVQFADFRKSVYKELKTIDSKLDDVRLEMAKEYLPRKEMQDIMAEIKATMQRIESKLDSKADK